MTTELRWQKCERAWGDWLRQQGWNVLPAHTLTNNVDTTAAPMIQLADGTDVIAPDYVVNKDGVYVYWDVKYRSFREVSMYNGEEYFWIPMHQFMSYFRLRQATGNQVNLVFYDNSQVDEDKRWLTTDVYAVHQFGQQVQAYDHKHNRYISAMSVPMSILRANSGPAIDRTTPVSLSPTIDKDENSTISNRARLAELCNQLQLQTIPRYSLVWFGVRDLDNVLALMHFGIRIFLVTNIVPQVTMADTQLQAFVEARFLEWSVDSSLDAHISGSAIDGVWTGEHAATLPTLFAHASQYPGAYGSGINELQYNIVHAGINEDIIVMAGAGTGKTETMAERLMFILTMHDAITQTQPLSLKDIALVTFTRDAAREMRGRIARTIVLRRRLAKYCVYPVEYWLNQLGKAQISTIHSFSKKILQRFGGLVGMAPEVLVSQRIVERRRFIKRHLSDDLANLYQKNPYIPAIHEWVEHIETVWDTLDNNGVDIQSPELIWSSNVSATHEFVVKITKQVIKSAHKEFTHYCDREHVVPMNQLVMRAQHAMQKQSDIKPSAPALFRYLFVDEFQDTDELQLALMLQIREVMRASLFIVGDVKQGVYRFRGASGDSFDALRIAVRQRNLLAFHEFPLTRNYRTDGKLLDSMHPYFQQWGKQQLLVYDDSSRLLPQHAALGKGYPVKYHRLTNTRNYVKDTADQIHMWRTHYDKSDSVAIICRINSQAISVQAELRSRGIDCELMVGGTFYQSPVVRELAVLISAVINLDDDANILQLCETRWIARLLSSHEKPPHQLCENSTCWYGDIVAPLGWYSRFMSVDRNNSFERDDLLPIKQRLASLHSMLNHMSSLSFLVKCRTYLKPEHCEIDQTGDDTERHRYARGLIHLMTLIDTQFGDAPITLTSLLSWLRIQIATNMNEDEPHENDPESRSGKITALTVHKSKGLEFDHVLVPHTWTGFESPSMIKTECAVIRDRTNQSLVWRWKWSDQEIVDNSTDVQWQNHFDEVVKEETRLLYVAMTRAKHNLLLFRPASYKENTWSHLLSKGGM